MNIGLWLEIRPADDVPALCGQVAEMGFGSVHAHFPQGCDTRLARALGRAAAASGLALAAVSGYANPLRPTEAPMGYEQAELAGLIDLLPTLGTRRIVTWSGTYGVGLLDDHPDNHTSASWDTLRRACDDLLPRLDAVGGLLLIEPFFSHILRDAVRVVRFCAELRSPYFGIVLDPPNLLPPALWPEQAARIAADVAALAPYTGLVHLKDMRLRNGALDLPGPGAGQLDYPALLAALTQCAITAPLIVEHVSLAQAPAARRFVLAQSRAAAPSS